MTTFILTVLALAVFACAGRLAWTYEQDRLELRLRDAREAVRRADHPDKGSVG